MPDTAEHRAEMHQLATQRRMAGQPVWAYKIRLADVFHNEALTFEERRDAIAIRLYRSKWVQDSDEWAEIRTLVDDLRGAVDVKQFDTVWDAIYDEADNDRAWIATR